MTATRRTFLSGLVAAPIAAVPAVAAVTANGADRLPALFAEKCRVAALVNGGQYATEAEADTLMDAWGACDAQAIASPASTAAGALASIRWARAELLEFGFDAGKPDGSGARIILALLDGAIGALRQEGGAA